MAFLFSMFLFVNVLDPVVVHGWQHTMSDVTVKFEEFSGKLTVSKGLNSLSIAFKEMVELAMNGVTHVGTESILKHRFRNFEYQQFYSHGNGEYVEVPAEFANISVFKKNFTAKLNGPAAEFLIEIWVYENNTIIPNSYSGERYQVYNGTVKVGFTIDNWRFCGYNDTCMSGNQEEFGYYLDISAAVDGGDDKPKITDTRGNSIYHKRPFTYKYGGGDVTFSQMYRLNDTWELMARDYPKIIRKDMLNSKNERRVENEFTIRFPVSFYPVFYNLFVNISSETYIPSSANQITSYFSTFLLSYLTFILTWILH